MPRLGRGQGSQSDSGEPVVKSYRFKVGDRVLCNTAAGFQPGRIIALNYQLPDDPEVHPYQVELNSWRKIYVPWDTDDCCKLHNVTWWEDLLDRDDLSDEEGVAALRDLSKGEDVNSKNYEGDTALHVCIRYKWTPGIETLLDLHADPNVGGKRQERVLSMAVKRSTGWVKMLLNARADPRLQDEDPEKDPSYSSKSFEEVQLHRSALHYAASTSKELARILLEARADINQADAQRKQPLHLAIEERLDDVVDLLLASRADVNSGNISIGLTSSPLTEATYTGDIALMSKLVAARADLNLQGKQGLTPLHISARGRNMEAARVLVDARADINIVAMGKTAAQLAAKNGAGDLASMLGHKGEAVDEKAPALDAELRKLLYID